MIEIGGRRARGCGKARGRELRVALLATSILGAWASAATAQPAPVLPSGGAVAAGSAVISGGGSTLTVSQGSAKAIVNWDSFSIGAGGAVRFDNGAGATLNRVKGGDLSQIDGLLSASGSVYLINPNGVLVGKTGVVNTGGSFVASTLDIADKDFLAGGALSFAGDSRAAVVNYGKIGSLGGDIALIASTVSNTGAINAANGDVGLLAGRRVVLRDLALDNGKFAVELGGGETSATNAGTIEGAMAELRANGGNVYALAGNVGSIIKATGVSARDGKVFLVAEGGALEASGAVSARAAGGAGGFVETSGETLKTDGLTVDAGAGGRWLLDPATLTIDPALAGTINATLAGGTNVTQQADNSLTVAAPLGWSTGAALTLTSGGTLAINAPITVSGAGQFTLVAAPTSPANLTISAPVEFGATAIAGQVLTINGQAYTLIRDRNGLEAAGGNGSYALATRLDLSGKTYGGAVIGSISGTFEGLGHTISNVTINAPFANLVGLFAISYGTIRDVGLIGGSVIGSQSVGGLVGYQGGGAIVNAFATGAVSGNSDVGGLVGFQAGSIDSSYAAGTVRGNVEVGGLAGLQTGSITNAYATGAVSGSSLIGGLVGEQEGGSITSAYATGAVSGNGNLGGLVGYQRGGSAANAFWDVTTTGQSSRSAGSSAFKAARSTDPMPPTRCGALWTSAGSSAFKSARSPTPTRPAWSAADPALISGALSVDSIAARSATPTPPGRSAPHPVTISVALSVSRIAARSQAPTPPARSAAA